MLFSADYIRHYKETLKLATPIILGQLSTIVIMITDNIVVGNFSADALAAASISHAIFMTLQIFGMGVTLGLTPLVATAVSARKFHTCRKLFKHSLLLYTFIGLVLCSLVLLASWGLDFFRQPAHITALAKPFLSVVGFSVIPFMIFQTFKQFMEGLSQTKEPMFVAIFGEVLNAGLNIVLVFGFLGFPRLGLVGSGVATLLARILMVLVIAWLFFNKEKFKKYAQDIRWRLVSWQLFKNLLNIGLPIGLQVIFESSCFAFSAIMAGWLPDNGKTLAAHQIALNIAATTYLIAAGFGTAAAIRTANQQGLKNPVEMQRAGESALLIVIVFMTLCAILLISTSLVLPSLYVKDIGDNSEVIAIASNLILLAAIFQLSDGIQVVSIGALRGLQDVKVPTLITLIAYWGVGTPLGALLAFYFGWGGLGIWTALLFSLTIAAGFLCRRFLKLSENMIKTNEVD